MEQNLKRISDELKLPRESRERIRSQLSTYQKEPMVIPAKKALRPRPSLVAAIVVLAIMLSITAVAAASYLFRNDIIVPDADNIPTISNGSVNGSPGVAAVGKPNGTAPAPLDEIVEEKRFKSNDWAEGKILNGGVVSEYSKWDSVKVLSDDPALRSRQIHRKDGAEKMEYTAESPVDLLDTLTGRMMFEPGWLGEHYTYAPDANLSFVVTAADGSYVSEYFSALYAKKDGKGYVNLEMYNTAQDNYFAQAYIVDGSYETAYYYTSADGHEFLIKMDAGNVWAECRTIHASVNLYGAYLTAEEVEDILDHLSLTIRE